MIFILGQSKFKFFHIKLGKYDYYETIWDFDKFL